MMSHAAHAPSVPTRLETSVPSRSSAVFGSAIDRTSMLWLSIISAHHPDVYLSQQQVTSILCSEHSRCPTACSRCDQLRPALSRTAMPPASPCCAASLALLATPKLPHFRIRDPESPHCRPRLLHTHRDHRRRLFLLSFGFSRMLASAHRPAFQLSSVLPRSSTDPSRS
jgi:hypothetical protein